MSRINGKETDIHKVNFQQFVLRIVCNGDILGGGKPLHSSISSPLSHGLRVEERVDWEKAYFLFVGQTIELLTRVLSSIPGSDKNNKKREKVS